MEENNGARNQRRFYLSADDKRILQVEEFRCQTGVITTDPDNSPSDG